mmetsp:Transcript_27097/g.73232  ORF Transcript_27097/g.73232 Transcript_27097/m.73232 type:complete len:268 (-) Transcript_27097:1920-2723(-)
MRMRWCGHTLRPCYRQALQRWGPTPAPQPAAVAATATEALLGQQQQARVAQQTPHLQHHHRHLQHQQRRQPVPHSQEGCRVMTGAEVQMKGQAVLPLPLLPKLLPWAACSWRQHRGQPRLRWRSASCTPTAAVVTAAAANRTTVASVAAAMAVAVRVWVLQSRALCVRRSVILWWIRESLCRHCCLCHRQHRHCKFSSSSSSSRATHGLPGPPTQRVASRGLPAVVGSCGYVPRVCTDCRSSQPLYLTASHERHCCHCCHCRYHCYH